MIRIFIIEDHEIFREGLKRIIGRIGDMEVVGEAGEADEGLRQLQTQQIQTDILLLDISLPGRNGIEALKEIKTLEPGPRVLILSMHPEDQWAMRALRAGASGYLTKGTATERLIEAIRKVHSGKKYVSPALADKLIDIIGDYSFAEPLKKGDKIVFEDMLHYTMVKNNTFNGVRLPSIGVWSEEHGFRLVRTFGYEDYKMRLS